MDTYGLIGFPLGHSFSKDYFEKKFSKEAIQAQFLNFEIEKVTSLPSILQEYPKLKGFSVTIPHKETIIPLLDELDTSVQKIGAVNSVKVMRKNGKPYTKGYNTDYYGFGKSLDAFLQNKKVKALILGTGGAAKAVAYALQHRNIEHIFVSRTPKQGQLQYSELNAATVKEYQLIINSTPLGTFPNIDSSPPIPYEYLNSNHFLFDLVYNPKETSFLRKGKENGAKICNGYDMLCYQADHSWEIWNSL